MQLRSWRLITAAIPSHSGRYSHDTAAISDVHQFLRGPRIPGGGLLFQLPTALSRCPGRSTRDMSRSVALVGDAHSVGACGVGTRTSGPGSVSLRRPRRPRRLAKFRQNVARFRLYRLQFLQENMRFAAFFKIYHILKLKFLKFGKILRILRHLQNLC